MKEKFNQIYFNDYGDFEIVSGTCAHSFPTHIHQSLCIGTITKGTARLTYQNSTHLLEENSQYIILPYAPHSIVPIDSAEYSYLTVCFKRNSLKPPDLSQSINLAKSFIESSEALSLTIEDISSFVRLSKFHLIRKFKEDLGITPYQFILKEKIKKIRQGILLKQSLSDLSLELGFSDQSHLSNTFKKYMGISPQQFGSMYQSH